MPKNELIDLLFGAFEKYTYWTLRGLKDYAKQPEVFNQKKNNTDISLFICKIFINYFFLVIILKSYLKDVLNEIAILDKRGPYNNCYHLKPEYSQQSSTA